MENTHKNNFPWHVRRTADSQAGLLGITDVLLPIRVPHETNIFVVAGLPNLTMSNILHIFNSSAHPNANSDDLVLYSSKVALSHKIYIWGRLSSLVVYEIHVLSAYTISTCKKLTKRNKPDN